MDNIKDEKPTKKDDQPKKMSDEARKKQREFFEELKKKENYRGVICNAKDTMAIIQLSRHFDKVMNDLRASIFNKFSVEELTPVFNLYNDVVLLLERLTEVSSEIIGHEKYKCSPHIKDIKKTHAFSEEAKMLIEKIEKIRPSAKKEKASEDIELAAN